MSKGYLPIEVRDSCLGIGVERMLLEISLLKVRIHIHARRTKVKRSRHIWNNAFSVFSDFRKAHPNIPVPWLIRGWPFRFEFFFEQLLCEHPTQPGHNFDTI